MSIIGAIALGFVLGIVFSIAVFVYAFHDFRVF